MKSILYLNIENNRYGLHGYIYNKLEKTKSKPDKYHVTNVGYKQSTDFTPMEVNEHDSWINLERKIYLDKVKNTLVNPHKYIDGYGNTNTENLDKIKLIINILNKIVSTHYNESNETIESVLIYTNDEYLSKLYNKLIKMKKGELESKKNDLGELYGHMLKLMSTIESGKLHINIFSKTLNLGEESSIFVTGGNTEQFKLSNIVKYWKPNKPLNRLLNLKYVAFKTTEHKHNLYTMFSSKEYEEIMKNNPYARLSVVVLKNKNKMIEEVQNIIDELTTLKLPALVRLENLFSVKTLRLYNIFGKDIFKITGMQTKNVTIFNGTESSERVGHLINPPGLFRKYERNIRTLKDILDSVINGKLVNVEKIDLTDKFFRIDTKKKKCVFRQELKVGTKEILIHLDKYNINFHLELGLDIPDRNDLKAMEKLSPKVYLITRENVVGRLDYYTIIIYDEGFGIYCNFYTNRIFYNLKLKKKDNAI